MSTPRTAFLFVAWLIGCVGCGAGNPEAAGLPNYGSEDGLKIAQMVSNFNEVKGDQAKFKKSFAASPTAEWKKYYPLTFEVAVGSPKVSGTEATAQVTIRKDADNSDVGKKEWTFAKSGNEWKIKSAPLP